ncbi:MAG: N-acetylmuramoyl-L-alanine amidase-like domain-containing protein, partial [Verrucomicrobiales bacterium]
MGASTRPATEFRLSRHLRFAIPGIDGILPHAGETMMNRRRFLPLLGASIVPQRPLLGAGGTLPFTTVFRGRQQFDSIIRKALRENWAGLPIGERMIKAGRELHGAPYKNFTLEIDDKIEAPSANLAGLDCWTFFEICLGIGRMLGWSPPRTRPRDLLREIEFTRYRGGVCHGNYLDRIHYLAEWYFENDARGVAADITRKLGGSRAVQNRKVSEMTTLWKHYRYLKHSPSLVPQMARHERRVEEVRVGHRTLLE